jgi:hypothetical protein
MGLSTVSYPPESFADIYDRGSGETFPRHLLEGQETGLVLFAAGFYGMHDAYWMAEAGVRATCVDIDQEKLETMRRIYPDDWTFACQDAFELAESLDRRFDVVTVDPGSNWFERVADLTELWCSLARRAAVIGAGVGTKDMRAPEGWRVTDTRRRSNHLGGVFWVVMELES